MIKTLKTIFIIYTLLCLLNCVSTKIKDNTENKKFIRIVSLSPNMTEILFYLGLFDRICGVTTDADYPAEVSKKEKVGNYTNPDIEKVYSLKPDIILYTGTGNKQLDSRIKGFGIKIWHRDINSLKDLYSSVKELGIIFDKEKQANFIIKRIEKRLNRINRQYSTNKRYSLYTEIWYPPVYTIGRSSFIYQIMSAFGFKNITEDLDTPFPSVDWEYIISKNPDVVIILHQTKKPFMFSERREAKRLNAVKRDMIIFDFNYSLLLRPGPRIAEGIDVLEKQLIKKGILQTEK